jgi:hypothetical protein
MIANRDPYRTANVLVQQYGTEDALVMAAKRADALLELGDVDGQRVWKGGVAWTAAGAATSPATAPPALPPIADQVGFAGLAVLVDQQIRRRGRFQARRSVPGRAARLKDFPDVLQAGMRHLDDIVAPLVIRRVQHRVEALVHDLERLAYRQDTVAYQGLKHDRL